MNGNENLVYLGLGSNIGDKVANIQQAYAQLEAKGIEIRLQSSFYQTPPWGFEAKEDFVNTVVGVIQKYSANDLLAVIKDIETDMGREKKVGDAYVSRIIDIDIVDFYGMVKETNNLVLPHPHLSKRNFVLYPLCEVAPNWIHPFTKMHITDLIQGVYTDDILLINN